MSDNAVTLRIPITMKIGPVPSELSTPEAIFSFGIQNFGRILTEKGIVAQVDGLQAVATFALAGEDAKSQTARGRVLDDRAFRVQPAGTEHQLELSTDLGKTFSLAATFNDYGFARAVGNAWVDGRVEQEA